MPFLFEKTDRCLSCPTATVFAFASDHEGLRAGLISLGNFLHGNRNFSFGKDRLGTGCACQQAAARVVSQFMNVFGYRFVFTLAFAIFSGGATLRAQDDRDLYLLAGQSNMAGRGAVDSESRPNDPKIFAFGKDRTWQPAADPLHFDKPAAGVGPGLTFAQVMVSKTGRPVGLIPCAVGGTSILIWAPGKQDPGTKAFPYDDAISRTKEAIAQGGVLKGILWHQGESDLPRTDWSRKQYIDRLVELIARFRSEFGDVPVVIGELGTFVGESPEPVALLNKALQSLPTRVDRLACVSSEGLVDKGDKLHFDTASARTLGQRYAEAMIALSSSEKR